MKIYLNVVQKMKIVQPKANSLRYKLSLLDAILINFSIS